MVVIQKRLKALIYYVHFDVVCNEIENVKRNTKQELTYPSFVRKGNYI
jgi:hypothetical protein